MTADLSETEKARRWRIARGLTRPELAELTGYSVSSIVDYEGQRASATRRPIGAHELRRYRLCCAAVNLNATEWDWG